MGVCFRFSNARSCWRRIELKLASVPFSGRRNLYWRSRFLGLSRVPPNERSWGGTRDKPKNVWGGGYPSILQSTLS